MTLLGFDPVGLLLLAAVALVAVFAVDLLLERQPDRAAERTARRFLGVGAGAGSAVVAVLTVGVEVMLQLPEIVLTLLGVWAIVEQVDWDMFLALALIFYLIAQTVEAKIRGAGGA